MTVGMSCVPPPLVPPRQALHTRGQLLFHRLQLDQQQTLPGCGEDEVAHRQVLGRQQRAGFEMLQIPQCESGEWDAQLQPKRNLPKMIGKRWEIQCSFSVGRGLRSARGDNFSAFGAGHWFCFVGGRRQRRLRQRQGGNRTWAGQLRAYNNMGCVLHAGEECMPDAIERAFGLRDLSERRKRGSVGRGVHLEWARGSRRTPGYSSI